MTVRLKFRGDILDRKKLNTAAGELVELLKANNMHIALAESCTGGLVAKSITDIAGASDVFECGLVTYSDEMKKAYEFAYKHGITTMPTIEEADMEGPLTRIAMAKMLSQYAMNVL